MCLIEVQKYGITRRHESALAQKKKLAITHCEFFVSGYKTGTGFIVSLSVAYFILR